MSVTVLISDSFDADGVERLKREPLFKVIYKGGMKRDELLSTVKEAHALVIRSATQVDREVFEAAVKLRVVVRAGVGIDNIDLEEATRRGVLVMNAPSGNSVSTAEQTLALLFATARLTPLAHSSIKQGRWEKSKFKGVEITGKVIGIIGLGRIGREVAVRAKALQMKVIGFDPFLPAERIEPLGIESVTIDELFMRSDFITVHTPLTDTTRHIINKDNLHKLKAGVRLINCARGGIYEEEAIVKGLNEKIISVCALDVFEKEPLDAESPLLKLENCILTPHLGASTGDAEYAVAMESIDELIAFFKDGVARNALNYYSADSQTLALLQPLIDGGTSAAEFLARFFGSAVRSVEIEYTGEICKHSTSSVNSAILTGILRPALGERINMINAVMLAKDRGISLIDHKHKDTGDLNSSVSVKIKDAKDKGAELTFTVLSNRVMVTSFMGLPVEFHPEGILLVIENRDLPGVIGTLGTFLGKHNINIARVELARNQKGGEARCILNLDTAPSPQVLKDMVALNDVISAVLIITGKPESKS